MELKNNRIYLNEEERKKPKLLTGTRLGAVLGLNNYSSPFQCWAEMMHIYEQPYEDTIYTLAGKAIEPKQAEYMKLTYPNITYPKDIFGENYFSNTRGNFFQDPHFGGMWDYLDKVNDTINCVFEMKTAGVSKKKDWAGSKIPESYALQASLYAYLLGIDKVIMVATFLNQKNGDYEHPENFIVTDENTLIKEFKVSEKYPEFEKDYIQPALTWWNDFIETGISPKWDDTRDAEVLESIKNNFNLNINTDDNEINPSIVNIYTTQLDAMIDNINKYIIDTSAPDFILAKKYYMQLPILIYRTSNDIKNLNNLLLYEAAKDKLNNAKLIGNMLENILYPNQMQLRRSLNE